MAPDRQSAESAIPAAASAGGSCLGREVEITVKKSRLDAAPPCWRRHLDRLCSVESNALRRPRGRQGSVNPWNRPVACLDSTDHLARRTLRASRRRPVSSRRLPKACETCSTSTPSFSWRLQLSFSCKLRSVLGQRTGRERPPYDPYSRDSGAAGARQRQGRHPAAGRTTEAPPSRLPRTRRPSAGKGVAEPGSRIAAGLDAIVGGGPDLRCQAFPHRRAPGLRDDRHGVRRRRPAHPEEHAVARRVRGLRGGHPRARSSAARRSRRRFVSIDKADIVGAELRGRAAQVTVRFVSQLVSVTRDRSGAVIDGIPRQGDGRHRCVDVCP